MTTTFMLSPECMQWCKEQHFIHNFEFMYAFLAAEIGIWAFLMILEYGGNTKRNKRLITILPWLIQLMMLTGFLMWWFLNK